MFWPGSEAPVQGRRPQRWLPFDKDLGADARVEQVLAWFDEPDSTRPQLATLDFGQLHLGGHDHGPEPPQVRPAAASTLALLMLSGAATLRVLDGQGELRRGVPHRPRGRLAVRIRAGCVRGADAEPAAEHGRCSAAVSPLVGFSHSSQ